MGIDALAELVRRSRGPMGPQMQVRLGSAQGPFLELSALLSEHNGFAVFNAGVQVFRAGQQGVGPEAGEWNAVDTWKDTYGGLADGVFFFGQDLFGTQFGLVANQVIRFNPEDGTRTVLGTSLQDWATWLLDDPDVNGAYGFATSWQDRHGPLDLDQRLLPYQMFTLGGGYDDANLVVRGAIEAMRIRGPIAQKLHDLPDGQRIELLPTAPRSAAPVVNEQHFDVLADYHQFVLVDPTIATTDVPPDWGDTLVSKRMAIAPGTVGIGTERETTVPVTVQILTGPPMDDSTDWEHVAEGGMNIPSGSVLLSSTVSEFRLTVAPGHYRVRVSQRGLGTLSPDGLDGDDEYRVVLWPGGGDGIIVLRDHGHI